ncbi:helix-turn-helix domain-containing protein [Pseudophaeobacter arcticus]|uniref:helix-turn-helix domain-containing protein n=1 Tax=Pseudophaeobacter arcticus TaxID=385492 RepID=UPI003A9830D2
MAKRVSARKVKMHNQYTYQQAADLLGVSVQTVRLWRHAGLPVLNGQKPHLILGFALKGFLTERSRKPKRRLARDQFLCMACKGPTRALGDMADYKPYTSTRGRLEALCEDCEGLCGKFASQALCDELAPIMTIVIRNMKCP